jgi:hypothetical protein
MALGGTQGGARRTPLWAIAVAALLGIVGVTRFEGIRRTPVQRAANGRTPGWSSASEPEGDRGRRASTPAEIPAKGWKDTVLRIYQGISEDRILALAGGVTFYGLLALFPGIAGLIAVGAKLNAETEHPTARDSTVGRPEPPGRRGAEMADTVGPSQD